MKPFYNRGNQAKFRRKILVIEKIMDNLYTFQVELPNSPLKALNIYVIKDGKKALLFDTGYNMSACYESLLSQLHELDIEIEQVSLVLSHLHADHTGLAHYFSDAGCAIYTGKVDGELMNKMPSSDYWDELWSLIERYGMTEGEITIQDNPGYHYKLSHKIPFIELVPGNCIDFGDFHFKILNLRGHTPGHIGLYDEDHQLILSGDTILNPMTPNITFWGFHHPNILNDYIQTLKGLKNLPIHLALATHRTIIRNVNERIDELIFHHYERGQEILDAMKPDFSYTVREIASTISWRIRANHWDDFPKGQKWFAVGETMAHLDWLVHLGWLEMDATQKNLLFKKRSFSSLIEYFHLHKEEILKANRKYS